MALTGSRQTKLMMGERMVEPAGDGTRGAEFGVRVAAQFQVNSGKTGPAVAAARIEGCASEEGFFRLAPVFVMKQSLSDVGWLKGGIGCCGAGGSKPRCSAGKSALMHFKDALEVVHPSAALVPLEQPGQYTAGRVRIADAEEGLNKESGDAQFLGALEMDSSEDFGGFPGAAGSEQSDGAIEERVRAVPSVGRFAARTFPGFPVEPLVAEPLCVARFQTARRRTRNRCVGKHFMADAALHGCRDRVAENVERRGGDVEDGNAVDQLILRNAGRDSEKEAIGARRDNHHGDVVPAITGEFEEAGEECVLEAVHGVQGQGVPDGACARIENKEEIPGTVLKQPGSLIVNGGHGTDSGHQLGHCLIREKRDDSIGGKEAAKDRCIEQIGCDGEVGHIG
jgi:hypothetical protein